MWVSACEGAGEGGAAGEGVKFVRQHRGREQKGRGNAVHEATTTTTTHKSHNESSVHKCVSE